MTAGKQTPTPTHPPLVNICTIPQEERGISAEAGAGLESVFLPMAGLRCWVAGAVGPNGLAVGG